VPLGVVTPFVPEKLAFLIVITLAVSVMYGVNCVVTQAAGVFVPLGKVIPLEPPADIVIITP
jgi:hypothetical protein